MNKKEQRARKVQRQQEILSAAKAAHRELSDGERQEFDSLQREIEALSREIEAEEEEQQRGQQNDAAQRAIQEERARISEITSMCREFGIEDQLNGFIDGGTTVEEVRSVVIEQMRRERQPIGARATVETDENDKFRAAAADALLLRGGIELSAPAAGARELRSLSLRDLAIECLTAEGASGMSRKSSDELFQLMQRQFFNPSAAFPAIMDTAINKAYVEGHKTTPVTFDRWTKRGTLKDFKVHEGNYLAGPAGEFLEVPENGELKHDVWEDKKRPARKLKTYGRQFTLSRQAFINDDIGMIVRMPAKYAASARKTINKQCYQILMGNDKIYDGDPLFSKKHMNLLAKGTGIERSAVQGMILAMANQKDEFGEVCIIRPAMIVVPSGYQFDMYSLFYSPTINTAENTQAVNPLYQYRESIEVVEDPTINALAGGFGKQMPWWMFGAKEDTDCVEVDYLNGQDIPTIRRSEMPGTLGYVWDVYLDWGITVVDYRGVVKNPGIVLENPVELA